MRKKRPSRKESKETKLAAKEQQRALKADVKQTREAAREAKRAYKTAGLERRIRIEAKAEKEASRTHAKAIRKAKTAQKMLGFNKIYEDGICEIRPGLYSRTIAYQDIGYQTAREEEQTMFLNHLCYLINTCDESVHLQLNLMNEPVPRDEFAHSISLPYSEKDNESYIDEYNRMIEEKCAEQAHTLKQHRSYTVTVHAESLERARKQLGSVCNAIEEQLRGCGTTYGMLDGIERAKQLFSILRPEDEFDFDFESAYYEDQSVRDYVSPNGFDLEPHRGSAPFKFGDKYGQILFLRKYPAQARDDFMPALLDLSLPMSVSVHYQPMDSDEAEKLVQKKYAFMDKQRASEAKNAVRGGLDPSFVSAELLESMKEARSLLSEIRETEQKLVYTTIFIFVWQDSLEALEESVYDITKLINKTGKVESVNMPAQKRLAINACLPIGCDYVNISRALTTTEAALMTIPFAQIRMSESGGVYYGINADSGEAVVANRKNLKAPNGWVLAKPGRGKSFAVKREIFAAMHANPDDEFLIIDPQGEYGYACEAFGGEEYIISPESDTYLNPFDMSAMYAGEGVNPISFKSSFIITMIASLVGGDEGIDTIQQGIIDRCVKATYADYRSDWESAQMPTFKNFYEILKTQQEPEAQYLAKALELFVEGSLSVFTHHTNTSAHARLRTYNTKHLPEALKTLGMLIVLDQVNNRAAYNFSRGVRTWLYIDEAQNYFTNPHSIEYFDKTFSEGRKNLIIPTAITQNVDRVIKHNRAIQMFSNSDFMLLLGQSKNDLENHLVGIFGLSNKEREHLMTDVPGQGIVICGNRRVCVKDSFPKKTELYRLFSTDPNEREEEFKRRRAEKKQTA